jgi:hypothetical protein
MTRHIGTTSFYFAIFCRLSVFVSGLARERERESKFRQSWKEKQENGISDQVSNVVLLMAKKK